MKYGSRISHGLLASAPALLLSLLCAGQAHAATYPPVLNVSSCDTGPYTYAVKLNTSISDSPTITPAGGSGTFNWLADNGGSSCTSTTGSSGTDYACTNANLNFTLKLPPDPSDATKKVAITGASTSSTPYSKQITVTATNAGSGGGSCAANFTFHSTADGGGWGDPHLTTVDGVHYDFQSAGEFTALRDDKLVIQTRQSPVPTATVPITNEYTGITHCVAIYTAVAAKLGSTRVTLQPEAELGAKGMQLRVNGKPLTLGDAPLILRSEANPKVIDGTLTRHADGVIEMTDARGTQLVVTPQYWDSQKVWYLNVNVYGTSAHEGTMGSIAERSWLPALPDGSSLGPKPASEADRYQALYEKFADAWRVTNETSLFDYAEGTKTATFTLDEWPRNHPQSCAIAGQTSAEGVTEQEAQAACANVAATQKANCVFDVKMTGNKGFGKSYEITQRFSPRGPGWYTPSPPSTQPPSKCPPEKECLPSTTAAANPWCCWVLVVMGILQLLLLLVLVVRSSAKKP